MANDKEKTVTVYVNGSPKTLDKKEELTYDELVALAFTHPPTGENILITITYRKGDDKKSEGTVIPGGSVKVKDGMIFNVTATDKS